MMNERRNIIQDKTFHFALMIIKIYKNMIEKKEFVLSKQLLRSGTSIGANVEEALAALTKREFAHKMSLSSKEARETRYWLRLLIASELIDMDLSGCLTEADEIVNILTAIVKTSQKNIKDESKSI